MACEAVIAMSLVPPPVACQVVDLLFDLLIPSANPAPPPPAVTLELHATGVGESFKAKSTDLAALEVCLKGTASVCSRWSARLAMRCRRGTFNLSVPHCRLPSKVVSRRRMACPKSCSLRPLHVAVSSDLHYIIAPPLSSL
jgi:hypothetical protein